MGQKFIKVRVLDRLNIALKEARTEEAVERKEFVKAERDYPKVLSKWESDMTAWFVKHMKAGKWSELSLSGYDSTGCRPKRPDKPSEPIPRESENIDSLIHQVECAAGTEIYLANNVFIGLARYL
jgi:hypothetical protein